MSGGSYNYLCYQDADALLNRDGDLQEMADRLAGLGYANDAAKETQSLLLEIRRCKNRIQSVAERLEPVWHAIEWWDSNDWGEDQVKAAIAKYRGESNSD